MSPYEERQCVRRLLKSESRPGKKREFSWLGK